MVSCLKPPNSVKYWLPGIISLVKNAVSCTKLIPNLNLAEGRNFATGSQPMTQPFSSTKLIGFTEKRKLYYFMIDLCGGTPPAPPVFFNLDCFQYTRR